MIQISSDGIVATATTGNKPGGPAVNVIATFPKLVGSIKYTSCPLNSHILDDPGLSRIKSEVTVVEESLVLDQFVGALLLYVYIV